jgi:hypothetical protein
VPIEAVINTLHSVIHSIQQAIWLIDLLSEETQIEELSPQFQARLGGVLSSHLAEAVVTVEYAQDLIKRIERERLDGLPSQSLPDADSDRSTNPHPPSPNN